MRASSRAFLDEVEETAERVQRAHPTVALDRPSRDTMEVARALIGTNPQDVLDKLLSAQQEAGRIRSRIKEKESLLTTYKARFWSGGQNPSFFDLDRKALLAKLKEKIRASAVSKKTEAAIDDEAHSHPEYLDFVKQERAKRERMEDLQAEVSGLHKDLETALGVIDYYGKAWKSCDAAFWFLQSENRKTK